MELVEYWVVYYSLYIFMLFFLKDSKHIKFITSTQEPGRGAKGVNRAVKDLKLYVYEYV